jgi:hypothetical protein
MGFGVGTVRTQASIAVIFMVRRCYIGPALAALRLMKTIVIAMALALAVAGCQRDENSAAAGGTGKNASSMQTPKGGVTGQGSEGSTDDRNAPKRPGSRPARQ